MQERENFFASYLLKFPVDLDVVWHAVETCISFLGKSSAQYSKEKIQLK